MRKLRIANYTLLVMLAIGAGSGNGNAQTFTSIDFPGAIATDAHGINARGDIVGRYVLAGKTHGFLLSRGERDGDGNER